MVKKRLFHEPRSRILPILRGGQRLERLVEDFMLLQQIDVGHASQAFKDYRSPITIGEFLDQLENSAEEKFRDLYPDYVLRIKSDRELRHLRLEAFPPQLVDAFLRLLDNAFKFSPEQKVGELRVESNENDFFFRNFKKKGIHLLILL